MMLVWLRSACGLRPAAPAALNITSSERTYAVALVGLVSIDAGNVCWPFGVSGAPRKTDDCAW